jgi:hypothetical protein
MPPSRLMKIHPEPETQKCPEVRRAKKSIGALLILTVTELKLKIRKPHPMLVFQNMKFRIRQHIEQGRLRAVVVQRT